jgi:hypothetical protein
MRKSRTLESASFREFSLKEKKLWIIVLWKSSIFWSKQWIW